MKIEIKIGNIEEFTENMQSQKRWLLNHYPTRQDEVKGLICLLDCIGDVLVDKYNYSEYMVFGLGEN